jgi:glycosyltransferase involved in cell wall biosynthesis
MGEKEDMLRPKRVLIVAHNHPDLFAGGGEILAWQLFDQLKREGIEALFLGATGNITRQPHNGTPFLAMVGKADEFLFHNDYFDYLNQSNRKIDVLARELIRFLQDQKPDIIHFHHTLRYGVEALAVARRALPDTKIIYTLHDYLPICHRDGQMLRQSGNSLCHQASPNHCHQCFPEISAAKFRLREQFIKTHFDLVDQFIAPSRFLAERYVNWGVSRTRISVIENGTESIPPVAHRTLPRGGSRNRFTVLGQISPYKGSLLLAEAVQHLLSRGEEDFSIAIHGNIALQSTEFKKEFVEKTTFLTPYITIHGTYSRDQLPSIMAETDWLIIPSIWWENAPLVIAEALHHRRPVICSNIGGMAEKVQHAGNGLHFRVGSAQGLADIMQRAMHEKGMWRKLVDQISPPTTMTDCAAQHIQLYGELMMGITSERQCA